MVLGNHRNTRATNIAPNPYPTAPFKIQIGFRGRQENSERPPKPENTTKILGIAPTNQAHVWSLETIVARQRSIRHRIRIQPRHSRSKMNSGNARGAENRPQTLKLRRRDNEQTDTTKTGHQRQPWCTVSDCQNNFPATIGSSQTTNE